MRREAAASAALPAIGRSALLSLAAMLAGTLPSLAATVVVTDQAGFDANVQSAITTGQPNTIDVNAPLAISADTGLVLPGQASPLNLNFGLAPIFGVGNGSTGSLTIGAGTNITFTPTTSYALFRVGHGAGASGTITMTGGTITGEQSLANYLSFSVGNSLGTGVFNQSGGTFNVDGGAFQIGIASGRGPYNLSGAGVVNMGANGTVYLGDSVGGVGNLNVSGSASFTSGGQMYVGNAGGVGTITQNGPGSLVVLNGGNSFGTSSAGGTGTYNLDNGSLQIADASFASFGSIAGASGILNQSGGALTTTGTGSILIGENGAGQYNMSGGTATLADGLTIGDLAGSTGVVTQTGGLVTISGGALNIGAAGAGAYDLNGGMLQVGGANGIVGTGSLNLAGGALQVIGSALTTATAVTLAGADSTIDTNGLGATFSGAITGAGALTKLGAGALILTATDLYSGGTTIAAGTLQIGDGATGSIVGNVADNGTLAFDRSNAAAFAGAITGSGGLTQLGAGVLTLSGPGSYAGATLVSAGTLQAGAANVFSAGSAFTVAVGATLNLAGFNNAVGSLAGAGAVTLGAAILTTGGDGTSTTFSGAIGGAGGLTKVGAGTLFLTGASAYTGPTNVNAGILDVNGSLASSVAVNAGGTLMGGGAVGGVTIGDGGIIAPGNSIGTLHIAGAVGFAAGSVYQVQINASGQSDLIAATGHATLAGGQVQVSGPAAFNLTYTILTAQGGVSGAFAGASGAYGFLTPQLTYTPDSVLLTLQQSRSFASAAATPNQAAVAASLAALPTSSALFQAVLTQASTAAAQQAFDALSGEIHASVQSVVIEDAGAFRQAMLDRLRQADFEDATGPTSAFALGGPQRYSDSGPGFVAPPAYADAPMAKFPARTSIAPTPPPETVWWAEAIGAWGRIDGDGNAAGVTRDLGGFFSGVDRRLGDNWRAGIAGGYTGSNVSDDARASAANIDTTHLGVYASANYGAWTFRAGAAGSWSTIGTDRSIAFPGFSDSASAHYGAATAQIFDEIGYAVTLGPVAAEPFAGLAWVHLSANSFTETGATMAALSGASSDSDVGYSTLGARFAATYALPNGMALTPRAALAWQHAFGDVTPQASLAFQGAPSSFIVAGAPLARDAALIEAGFDVRIAPQATVGISYAGQLAPGVQDQSVKGNLLFRF